MEVLVADPFADVSDSAIRQVGLDELLAASDYVVCLAIANAETENLIGEAALARMQKHAVFINLSRGNLVDEAALARALRENRIAGAAMDVGRAPDQMPTPELARTAQRHRHPACRRADAAGDRVPVAGNRAAGGGDRQG
ncbi:hypothetical protein BRDID11002_57730 [Bradyrhizobium diazoefficiens]